MSAADCMRAALETFEQRAKVYGDSYTRHGEVMAALFPKGVELTSKDDFNRFGILNMQVSKLIRYTQSWHDRHIDSSHDMGVYCFMQEELDRAFHDIKSNNFHDDVVYKVIEIYDNFIRYDREIIYRGNTKNLSQKEIDDLVAEHKTKE